jgi:hypothetical protein
MRCTKCGGTVRALRQHQKTYCDSCGWSEDGGGSPDPWDLADRPWDYDSRAEVNHKPTKRNP